MQKNPLLSFEFIGSSAPDSVVVMLHGILGQKRNLTSFAREFCATFPKYSVMLVDLRHHGTSQGFGPPNTLKACAQDLAQLLAAQKVQPRSVIGHSFGAGVAATFADQHGANLKSLWLLDAILSLDAEQPRALDSVTERVLGALATSSPCDTKAQFSENMIEQGISKNIVAWLSMNLVKEGDHLAFKPAPADALEMLEDFKRNYSLDLLSSVAAQLPVFLVKAQGNSQWTDELVQKIDTLSREVNVQLLCLPQSGHWVHIDNPKGVLELMAQDFA